MSMYNTLFGTEPTADLALKMLGITRNNVPRFRDAYFSWIDEIEAEPVIIIYTRTGGGNRDFYENETRCRTQYPEYFTGECGDPPCGPWNDDLRKLPGYYNDRDFGGDITYAFFYFKVPEDARQAIIDYLTVAGCPATSGEKFAAAIAALKKQK